MHTVLVLLAALSTTTAYLDQPAPGQVASPFAPGIVSVDGRYEYAVSWSPDRTRMLFTAHVPDAPARLFQVRQRPDGAWTDPEAVSLSAGALPSEMEAFFAPDGQTVYRARPGADGHWHAEPAGLSHGGHPFIAPDQSFVLLDSPADDSLGKRDIYAAFATEDGGWSEPVNLGPRVNSEYSETCPSLSPDGRYLFFSRYDEPNDVSQIYWVDARVIETARGVSRRGDVARLERIVQDSIAWALTKDRALLESIIAHDAEYTSFHPEGLEPVRGYEAFSRGFDLWMDDRFTATRTEVRDLHCRLSRGGQVAWWSAILDDCFTWDGRPGCWQDTRWTGVLERRDGRWVIVQMHFSFAHQPNDG